MAGISETIVQGLMNPAWAKGLGNNISQGMTSVGQSVAKERVETRERNGLESIDAILNGRDPLDPRVVQAVQAVATQQRLDPNVVQQRLRNAQQVAKQDQRWETQDNRAEVAAQNSQERLELARKAEARAAGTYDYNERLRERQEQEAKVANAAIAAGDKGADREKFLEQVPEEVRGVAGQQYDAGREAKQRRSQLAEQRELRKPVSPDYLSQIKEDYGEIGERYVDQYNQVKETAPGKAREQLYQNVNKMIDQDLQRRSVQVAGKSEVDFMEAEVARVDNMGWFGGLGGEFGIKDSDYSSLALRLADKRRMAFSKGEEFVLTPTVVMEEYKKMKGSEENSRKGVKEVKEDGTIVLD